jgi:hypothetical protein
MLQFLFKSELIFTTMGSSRALTQITRVLMLYPKFKSASGISSGAPNAAVQFEHATIFI